MQKASAHILRILRSLLIALAVLALLSSAGGQERNSQQTAEQSDEVIRINTELVQTDVTVVDKQGRFVEGLKPEQFELRVGGEPRAISFFERITSGSLDEERQLQAARSGSRPSRRAGTTSPQSGGRQIFFFVDDLHLAAENLARARQALQRFVEDEMAEGDRIAIVSTSGRIGFLQQLTGNKSVLLAAVSRLDYTRNPEANAGPVNISEYDAGEVEAHNRELFRYLVGAMARAGSTNPAGTVINRSRQVAATARFDTVNTLGALDRLLRSAAPLPGRKVLFFISDGFVADPRRSGVLDSLRHITATAAQVGAVIYTMDARGSFADTSNDVTKNVYPDFTGSVSRNIFDEAAATQAPLRILAEETGGEAILNSNSFAEGFRRALGESSSYYLIAWRPEQEERAGGKARIKVSVKGRPDLKVRVRRGFIALPRSSSTEDANRGRPASQQSPESELLVALSSLYPAGSLPVSVSVGYMWRADNRMVLTASMQMETAALREESSGEARKTEVDVLGVALDDRGPIYSFKQKLTFAADSAQLKGQQSIVWNQQLPLAPGLYQVRVAVRDRQSGRTGSAMQWIEIPRITPSDFAMSSIFIGERRATETEAAARIGVSVNRRLSHGSRLRFQTYIYNAQHRTAALDVMVQVRIFRDGQPVLVMPQSKLPDSGAVDPARLSYSGELDLERLAAGRYLLQISASDQNSGKSISQQTDFIIE